MRAYSGLYNYHVALPVTRKEEDEKSSDHDNHPYFLKQAPTESGDVRPAAAAMVVSWE